MLARPSFVSSHLVSLGSGSGEPFLIDAVSNDSALVASVLIYLHLTYSEDSSLAPGERVMDVALEASLKVLSLPGVVLFGLGFKLLNLEGVSIKVAIVEAS